MRRQIRSISTVVTLASMCVMLTGCGLFGFLKPDEEQGPETEQTTGTDETPEADGDTDKPSAPATQAASPLDELTGNWVFVCSMYHTEYDDGDEYSSTVMCTDDYAPDSALVVRKDGDRYYADFKMEEYESTTRIYGSELTYRDSAAYPACPNQDWCAEMADPFKDMESVVRKLTLNGDMLLECEVYTYKSEPDEEGETWGYYSVVTNCYLPEGSDKLNDPESLRYFDTVTVSSAEELLNSIQNNRRIILESGTYNISKVPESAIDNRAIDRGYSAPTINGISNLSIEADDGALVLICVSDPYDPVLWFEQCYNISLKGLTVGHDVEPGYCSGSVLYLQNGSDYTIDDCHLFGCGTYGIEANYAYDINVTDTEIYECTYGLLDLNNTSSSYFTDCVFRDSKDMDMINLYNAYDVVFDNCSFRDNVIEWDNCSFIDLNEYSNATFRNCAFDDNTYDKFSDGEVTMENCTMDGKPATYTGMLTISSTDDIRTIYDKNKARQREIDDEVTGGMLDQLTLNQYAYEEYNMWDALLNGIWGYMVENFDEATMNTIREEQKAWIKDKEAEMKESGSNFEGGSMQPMLEYGAGARLTRERVEALMSRYLEMDF